MSKPTEEMFELVEANTPDDRKLAFLDNLPTEPGMYYDKTGALWLRTDDGHWYDQDGDTADVSHNWILGIQNMTRIPHGTKVGF
jgi:hypothetical protein